MTPIEQIAANKAMHARQPWLLDLLAFWEAMDAATAHDPETDGPAKSANVELYELRQEVGVGELRDLCVTLFEPMERCYADWKTLYGEFETAFDWEWLPAYISAVDWNKTHYNPVPYALTLTELPTAQQVNAKLDTPYALIAKPALDLDTVIQGNDETINTDRIVQTYQSSEHTVQQVIDDIFISLTGWSLKTLIEKGNNP